MPKKSADTNSVYMWDNSYPSGKMPAGKKKPAAPAKKPAASAQKYPKPLPKKQASLPAGITRKVSAGPTGSKGGRTVRVSPRPKPNELLELQKIPRGVSRISKIGSAAKKNTRAMYSK